MGMSPNVLTWIFSTVNLLLVILLVIGIPAAIIYGIVLLRRIAKNTERDSN